MNGYIVYVHHMYVHMYTYAYMFIYVGLLFNTASSITDDFI